MSEPTFETITREALDDPQPGDWWNEMCINYHLVVAVQGKYVFVLKETEPVDEKTHQYTGKIEMWDRETFKKQCDYGFPYRNTRLQSVNIARKELCLEPIEATN
jgi:hypothetical protein